MLEVIGIEADEALIAAWSARVERAGAWLAWHDRRWVARRHARGLSLALTAPCDQLFLATEVNEWALCAALAGRDSSVGPQLLQALAAAALEQANGTPAAVPEPPVLEESAALARFVQLAEREAHPALRALLAAAEVRGLSQVIDDDELTLGAGSGGRSFLLGSLPDCADVPWNTLHNVPTALVTGSNGKTTTVRLLAACARAHGWHTGYNCTDGVYRDSEVIESGDYSGPAGARRVLREPLVEAAILETARGGILRRGIAVSRTDVAVVTNVSADHFGEFGIDDLAALADVKLSVASLVGAHGLLVLNADDPQLRRKADQLAQRFGSSPPLAWFSLDADLLPLRQHRAAAGSTCGVSVGRMLLNHRGNEHDLGPINAMPLSVGGVATYNVANLAAAALAAVALSIPATTIAQVFARFGTQATDNPGRLMRFEVNGAQVLVDYAHNPDGLRGLLTVARHLLKSRNSSRSTQGRLGLLLGHAGNRRDADIEALARVAAEFRPDLVVVKEVETHLRGRTPGEIPRIIRAELLRAGMPAATLPVSSSEVAAVRHALEWAQPGDVLALLVHSAAARATVLAMLNP